MDLFLWGKINSLLSNQAYISCYSSKIPLRQKQLIDLKLLSTKSNPFLSEHLFKTNRHFCNDECLLYQRASTASFVTLIIPHSIIVDHLKDERKRAVVRDFNACKPESTIVLMQCQPQNLVANCKMTTQFCTYGMTCPLDMRNGHWTCNYNHKFASLKCCDYTCKV